jgi:antitoxin component YwqK of YwqJK toxin-antitoxin module
MQLILKKHCLPGRKFNLVKCTISGWILLLTSIYPQIGYPQNKATQVETIIKVNDYELTDTAFARSGRIRYVRYYNVDHSKAKLVGLITRFNRKGQVTMIHYFGNERDDKKFTVIEYYSNGNYKRIYNQERLKIVGLLLSYYENGQIKSSTFFDERGKIRDVISQFDSLGKELEKGTLRNGSGSYFVYDEHGGLKETIYYKNGVKVSKK